MKVNPEFEALIPPLMNAEREALRASIIEEGRARDPLVMWGDTLVDGHNRLAICLEEGLPYTTVQKSFASESEAKEWILSNQTARRNLTPDQVLMIAVMRGIEPPVAFRSFPGRKTAQELVAADSPEVAKVLSGKHTLRIAQLELRKARGEVTRKPRAPKTDPSPPPPPSLDDAIVAALSRREDSNDKRQLRDALKLIQEYRTTIERLSAPMPRPAFSIVRHLGSDKRKAWGLSIMSDIHAGAHVEPSRSVCMNRYNPEICRHRLDRYFESLPWLINDEHAFDVEGHCLAVIGDLIDGHLHDDQTETSEAPLVTINWLEPFLFGRIESLATELGDRELRIIWVPGNHGRDTLKPRAATYCHHSHEWALGQRLARHFDDHKTIRVHAPTARDVYTTIYDREIHATHGDTVSYGGGIGGITIPLRKAYAIWQVIQPSYLHLTGHFHTQLDLGDGLANGSGIGYNDFARKMNARPEVAQQIFCLIDYKRGKTKVSPIWMHDLDAEEKLALAEESKLWEMRNVV